MKRFDVRWATLITFIVMLLGWWYWYEYRPQKIREECTKYAIEVVPIDVATYQKQCVDIGGVENFKSAYGHYFDH